jgi:hypothetical protein
MANSMGEQHHTLSRRWSSESKTSTHADFSTFLCKEPGYHLHAASTYRCEDYREDGRALWRLVSDMIIRAQQHTKSIANSTLVPRPLSFVGLPCKLAAALPRTLQDQCLV